SGLADTLTYKLGLLKKLIVLAPSSTFEFRGPGLDLKVVGAKLGATAMLEGTVRRAGGMLRVNARLVDIVSGQQLWSGSYDRSDTDLFAVQDEIATAVTEALHVVLSPGDESLLAKTSTLSLTAYDAYLKAQPLLATRLHDNMQTAVDYLREATHIDPDYALAWAGLAQALTLAAGYGTLDWGTVAEEAHNAAAKARALDLKLGEAYLAEALVAVSDNQMGGTSQWPDGFITGMLQRALELSPNNSKVLKLQSEFVESKEEGLALLKRAAQLDPEAGIIHLNIAQRYLSLRRFEEANEWGIKAMGVTHPPAELVYATLGEAQLFEPGGLANAARWVLDYQRRFPRKASAYAL
ncbi:MAG: hypothetical protein ACREB3_15860, partial [Burkholderiales bacterium]